MQRRSFFGVVAAAVASLFGVDRASGDRLKCRGTTFKAFRLEPVGQDWDGQFKPISDLCDAHGRPIPRVFRLDPSGEWREVGLLGGKPGDRLLEIGIAEGQLWRLDTYVVGGIGSYMDMHEGLPTPGVHVAPGTYANLLEVVGGLPPPPNQYPPRPRPGDRVVTNPATWGFNAMNTWGRGVGVGTVVAAPDGALSWMMMVQWPTGACLEDPVTLLPAPREE